MKNRLDLPSIRLELVEDRSDPAQGGGFLKVRRFMMRNHYADGTSSRLYAYDLLERHALDAVCVLAFRRSSQGIEVLLRSSLRPPLAFRELAATPRPHDGTVVIWELPAGLVEPDEKGDDGIARCAARELHEETGYRLEPARFRLLGGPFFLSPGVLGEMIYVLSVEVADDTPEDVGGDGSPVEDGAVSVFVPLVDALAACLDGRIRDAKTELALRRFAATSEMP